MSDRQDFTDAELAAYIAETLSIERSTQLEQAVRSSPELQSRVGRLLMELEDAAPGVGAIWRRRRVSCPPRETWLAYLADEIGGELREYLLFHLDAVGCRYCAANLADLQQTEDPAATGRVRKFFQTSIGRLKDAVRAADEQSESFPQP